MRLSLGGHACARLEGADGVLVIDPGGWSDPGVLDGASAVLVTHVHPDHLAVDAVRAALAADPDLTVDGPGSVVAALVDAGAPADRVRERRAGEVWDAAGFEVEAVGGQHAVVHPDLPGTANLGYLVDGAVLHPGDSTTVERPTDGLAVLLVPVAGPWLAIADAIDLVRSVRPDVAVPIHDGALTEAGRDLVDGLVGRLGGAGYRRLGRGESLDVRDVGGRPAEG